MAQPKINNLQLAGPLFDSSRIIRVEKAGGQGIFTSIKDAVDSITDSSIANPYTVMVGPGFYTEDPITMKPYVCLSSWGNAAQVIIAPTTNTQPIITAVSACQIERVTLYNAIGVGGKGIYYTPTTDGPNGTLRINHVTFWGNETDLHVVGNPFTTYVLATNLYLVTATLSSKYHIITDNPVGAGEMAILMTTIGITNVPPAPTLVDAILVTGANNTTIINGLSMQAIGGSPAVGNGVVVQDGAYLDVIASSITGYVNNIQARNVGAAPTMHIAVNLSTDSVNRDLSIEHPGTMGLFSGAADKSKVFIDSASPLAATFANTNGDSGTVYVGPLIMGPTFDTITEYTNLFNESLATGLLSGGDISQGVNPLDLNVLAGYGYVSQTVGPVEAMKKVTWITQDITLPDDTNSYIYVNNAGTILTSISEPSDVTNINLGRVRTLSGVITYISETPRRIDHISSSIDDYLRVAIGAIYVSGSTVTENVTPLHLDVTSGHYHFSIIDYHPSGGTNIDFFPWVYYFGTWVKGALTNVLSNTQYNNPNAGYQDVIFGVAKAGGDPTGLANDATVYTASVTVDGVAHPIAVTGSIAQTFTTLLNEINTDLTGFATASLVGGNIRITDTFTGIPVSSVAITDTDLFSTLTNYSSIGTAVNGGLVNLTAGYYTKHTLYIGGDGTNEQYGLIPGQAEYLTLLLAQQAALPTPPPVFIDNITPIAAIIVQQGTANIVEIVDIRPRIGFQNASTSAAAVHGNLLGLSTDDHPQYLLTNGTRTLTGDINMGANSITNVNLVDGVDVSTHQSRHLPNGADPLTTAAPLVSLSLSSLNDVGTANSLARSDHSHALSGVQAQATILDNIAALAVTGLISRTGVGIVASRTITGTANQITLSNGDGVAGNPTISITTDPILPGTGSVTVPTGTTAQRPVTPTVGMIRFNTTAVAFEGYHGAWANIAPYGQIISGSIAGANGVTTIPFDNTAPLSTEGTQIWTQSITPRATTSTIGINFDVTVDSDVNNATIILAVFRGTTCIATSAWQSGGAGSDRPATMCVQFVDSPATTSATTYSARIGTTSGTWYVNSTSGGNNLGGTLVSSYTVKERLATL